MSEPLPLRRPSDRVDELRDQLLRELKRLESGDGKEPELFRAYLRHAQALAWQGVAEGRMEAPRELLNALRAAEPFVFSHLEESPDPLAGAAQEVHFTLRALRLATEALGERRIEDHLADDRSRTEREILRVLAKNRDRYLRRGAIHKRLELEDPPTPARVGQILVELDAEGLLLRIHGRAQGNPNAAFYALSGMGLDLCRNLNLIEEDEPRLDSRGQGDILLNLVEEVILLLALDSQILPERRSLLHGLIESHPTPDTEARTEALKGRFSDNPDIQARFSQITEKLKEAAQVLAVYGDTQHQKREAKLDVG